MSILAHRQKELDINQAKVCNCGFVDNVMKPRVRKGNALLNVKRADIAAFIAMAIGALPNRITNELNKI